MTRKIAEAAAQILKTPGWFTAAAVAQRGGHNQGTVQTVLARMMRMGAVRRRGIRGALQYYVEPEWVRGHRDPVAVVYASLQKVGDIRRCALNSLLGEHPWLGRSAPGRLLLAVHAHERRGVNPVVAAQKLGVTVEKASAEFGRLVSLGLVRQTPKNLFTRTAVGLAEAREILEATDSAPAVAPAEPDVINFDIAGAEDVVRKAVAAYALEAARARYAAVCRRFGVDPNVGGSL